MNMREFAGSSFITVETLRDGPREEVIVSVEPGKYDKPVATFESGDHLTLNKTNVRTLVNVYGEDSRDWVGCNIELSIGVAKYNGDNIDSVIVNPISAANKAALEARTPVPKQPPPKNEMNDDIPF